VEKRIEMKKIHSKKKRLRKKEGLERD